ncbi:MAG: hypothetical protein WD970_01080 [Patescibacteria group bacterium]
MLGGWLHFWQTLLSSALAHEGEQHANVVASKIHDFSTGPLDQLIATFSVQTVYVAAISLGFLFFIAVVMRNPSESAKRIIFWAITGLIALTTGTLIGMTVYLNQVSVTKGPVHWHADFQIWACGSEQDLLDPTGLSNKIGTPTLHEHNDKRIHVEGVVVEYRDVNLGAFFQAIGGELTNKSLTIPTNTGAKTFINGQNCGDTEAILQTFVYTTNLDTKTFSQRKIDNFAQFRYAETASVPPGECIIIEFDAPKVRTDNLCQSYQVAKTTGELTEAFDGEGGDGN